MTDSAPDALVKEQPAWQRLYWSLKTPIARWTGQDGFIGPEDFEAYDNDPAYRDLMGYLEACRTLMFVMYDSTFREAAQHIPKFEGAAGDLLRCLIERRPPDVDAMALASPATWISAAELASHLDLPLDKLRKRLERHRKKDPGCYKTIESSERAVRTNRNLWHVASILPVIEALRKAEATKRRGEGDSQGTDG